jgi:hypothetical protein
MCEPHPDWGGRCLTPKEEGVMAAMRAQGLSPEFAHLGRRAI